MDTDDLNTAKKIWRWNLNGLGYSKNGINGPYETAITQDGKIVADFITTGTMSVDRIEGLANVISDYEKRIAEITITLEGIKQTVENKIEFKRKECGTGQVKLENCKEDDLYKLNICGAKEYNNYLFPRRRLISTVISFQTMQYKGGV